MVPTTEAEEGWQEADVWVEVEDAPYGELAVAAASVAVIARTAVSYMAVAAGIAKETCLFAVVEAVPDTPVEQEAVVAVEKSVLVVLVEAVQQEAG